MSTTPVADPLLCLENAHWRNSPLKSEYVTFFKKIAVNEMDNNDGQCVEQIINGMYVDLLPFK